LEDLVAAETSSSQSAYPNIATRNGAPDFPCEEVMKYWKYSGVDIAHSLPGVFHGKALYSSGRYYGAYCWLLLRRALLEQLGMKY
jgi:hypothetical protein